MDLDLDLTFELTHQYCTHDQHTQLHEEASTNRVTARQIHILFSPKVIICTISPPLYDHQPACQSPHMFQAQVSYRITKEAQNIPPRRHPNAQKLKPRPAPCLKRRLVQICKVPPAHWPVFSERTQKRAWLSIASSGLVPKTPFFL